MPELTRFVDLSSKALFGRRLLGHISALDYIDWAVEMLLQDYDSLDLRILAGLDRQSSIFEVEGYFFRALKELNIEAEVEAKDAVQAYAYQIAQQIINGHFSSSRRAIRNLYRICVDTNYASDYRVWLELDDALDSLQAGDFPYTYPSATLENFDALIKQEAANLIARINN